LTATPAGLLRRVGDLVAVRLAGLGGIANTANTDFVVERFSADVCYFEYEDTIVGYPAPASNWGYKVFLYYLGRRAWRVVLALPEWRKSFSWAWFKSWEAQQLDECSPIATYGETETCYEYHADWWAGACAASAGATAEVLTAP